MPTLTAIISLYNSSKWLNNRLCNLMDTTLYKKGQLLLFLVNAQSPDPGDDKIANMYAGHPNLHYEVLEHKCTVYSAWNHAIRKTNTEYLTNANTDDLIAPDAYEKLINACKDRNSPLAYPDWYVISQDNLNWHNVPNNGDPNTCGQYDPNTDRMSCGHFPLWRRDLHDTVGLFDPWYQAAGDADFWYRCWKMGIRNFTYYSEMLGGYLWRYGDNLWHRADDTRRTEEWARLSSRQAVKLTF